ncbi:ABC transporter permease [Streptomyces sp. NPDC057376]|uniref:ABC transporter permease n=1 Tax=Streptomyces sp. NPDC057376 TaxID=3346110 RepID=UPI003632558E
MPGVRHNLLNGAAQGTYVSPRVEGREENQGRRSEINIDVDVDLFLLCVSHPDDRLRLSLTGSYGSHSVAVLGPATGHSLRRGGPLLRYVLRKLLRGALVILLVTFMVVLLMGLAPGSVATVILGESATPQAVAELEREMGLDRSVLVQWFSWLGSALQGGLGTSPVTNQPVTSAIVERLPVTLEIAALALLLALVIGVLLATVAARQRPDSPLDRGINGLTSVFLAIPAFVAAPVLVYLLAVQTRVFPVTGWVPLSDGLGANLRTAFLPALCVALIEVAVFQRILRADLRTTLREDYVEAARAKGLSGRYILWRHAFRPASFSLLTVAGVSLGRLVGGTVIVETFFSLPGLGQLVSTAVTSRDIVTVQGVVAFVAAAYVLINTLVDLGYEMLDPRVRLAGAR